jgi:GT2 family glycosyltransferase
MSTEALLVPDAGHDGQPGHAGGGTPHAPMLVGRIEIRPGTGAPPIADITAGPECTTARLLVTVRGVAVGQIELPLTAGYASAEAVTAAVLAELGDEIDQAAPPLPPVTEPLAVVVPTRGRPESLARCLRSLLRSDHPRLSVLVVDNDPEDDLTAALVHALGDARVTYVCEPRRGTSAGRNRGLAEAVARGARFVAFVDDDIEVDPAWAGSVAAALAQPGVACVCGPVTAAALDTPAQIAADEALGWRKGFARRRFSLAEPPPESAIFPFSPGLFGVGANMAVDAEVARRLGGFDVALGPGTRAKAGEDCDFMVRLVLAGHALAYEPSAYAWHHHRPTTAELEEQVRGYALGLGAFLTKIVLDRAARSAALRRVPAAVRRLRQINARESAAAAPGSSPASKVTGLAGGAGAYLGARRTTVAPDVPHVPTQRRG